MMRGVLDNGPYDVADGQASHHRAGWEWPGEILGAARAEKPDRVGVCLRQHPAGGVERGHGIESLGLFREIQVEAFAPGRSFDEPVESLGRVRDLLRDGHHAFPRTEPGIALIEDPGGTLEAAYANAIHFLRSRSPEDLARPLPPGPVMGGQPITEIVWAMVEHTAHHRGALTVYSRMIGKVPVMPYGG